MTGQRTKAWALESTETTNTGGSMKATGVLIVGDDSQNRQYSSVLSFDTAKLPDNSKITRVILKILKQGMSGADPFTTHGNLTADIVKGFFGTSQNLEVKDFQALATRNSVGKFVAVKSAPGWYQLVLGTPHFQYINLTGATQFRLRFNLDDNNDNGTDYVKFFAGDTTTPVANRPILIIEYIVP